MTPKQHFRALQIRLEIAEFGMGMPLDRERVKELREQVEQARKDANLFHMGSDPEQFEVFGGGVKPGWYDDELNLMTSDGVE